MKKNFMIITILAAFLWLTGFNIDNAIVPQKEILEPGFLNADQATFLKDSDEIIGVKIGGIAKAYPIKILNWHEVVNDTVDRTPVAVTF